VRDEPVAGERPVLLGQRDREVPLDGERLGLLRESQPPREAAHVGVDRDRGDAEGVAEHDVRGLPPHPGQRLERGAIGRDLAVVVVEKGVGQADELPGAAVLEPEHPHDVAHVGLVRAGEGGRVGPPPEELRGHRVHAFVGRLRGQDGRHEELERALMVEGAAGVRVGNGEPPVDLSAPLCQACHRGVHESIV
jgi:hypothetical protein